jgi:hypothetical protein
MAAGETVVVESESSVDALIRAGIYATTWAGGATSPNLGRLASVLAGAEVLVVPDNDPVGRSCGTDVSAALTSAESTSSSHSCQTGRVKTLVTCWPTAGYHAFPDRQRETRDWFGRRGCPSCVISKRSRMSANAAGKSTRPARTTSTSTSTCATPAIARTRSSTPWAPSTRRGAQYQLFSFWGRCAVASSYVPARVDSAGA